MGQSVGKSVFFIIVLTTGAAGLVGIAAAGSLPTWLAVSISALCAASLTAGLIQLRILGPLHSLFDELRGNLLGSSILFDANPHGTGDSTDETRDPMLCAIDRFRGMAEQMADHGNRIAIHAAEISYASQQVQSGVRAETRETGDVTSAVNRVEGAMNALAQSAAQAAVCAERADQAGASGQRALSSASQQIQSGQEQLQAAAEQLTALAGRSERIEHIFTVIGNISEQTELLALNAAGEAALAGEQGRGFAAVANEVRDLAQQTTEATREIIGTVTEMGAGVHTTATTVTELSRVFAEGALLAREAEEHLSAVQNHARTAGERMQAVSDGSSANWNELVLLGNTAQSLGSHLHEALSRAGQLSTPVGRLSSTAESILGQVITLGGQSQHAHMRFVAQSVAQSIGQAFEQGIEEDRVSESAFFDDVTPAEGNPSDWTTSFDAFAEEALPRVLEPVRELNPQLVYLGTANKDGRLSTRYEQRTQAERGESRVDSRCSSHTEPFLLQTFKEDSGDVMHDISAPIYVNDRHWGGFHMGYRAQAD